MPQFINLQNSYFLGEAFCNLHLEMQHKKVGLERSGGESCTATTEKANWLTKTNRGEEKENV